MKWACSLSAPPSWLTASTKRSCRSGVHLSLGLASVERTRPDESPAPAAAFPGWRNKWVSEEWMLFPLLCWWCCCWWWWWYIIIIIIILSLWDQMGGGREEGRAYKQIWSHKQRRPSVHLVPESIPFQKAKTKFLFHGGNNLELESYSNESFFFF